MSGKNWSTTSSVTSGGTSVLSRGSSPGVSTPTRTSTVNFGPPISNSGVVSANNIDFLNFRDYNNQLADYYNERNYYRNMNARDYYDEYNRDMYFLNRAFNEKMYNDAKAYDEYMSGTSIRRQVADLRAAGLNPVLASRLGGASYRGVSPYYSNAVPTATTYFAQVPQLDFNNYYSSFLNYLLGVMQINNSVSLEKMRESFERDLRDDYGQTFWTKLVKDLTGTNSQSLFDWLWQGFLDAANEQKIRKKNGGSR